MSVNPSNIDMIPDRIAASFEDKTLFVTGATGFVGKVLVEKLLRSCFQVKRIYVLVRSKKGIDPKERLTDMFAGPLFEILRDRRGGNIFEKVVPIVGDVGLPNLGISEEDRKVLRQETDFIYHCAASIRFDEPLKKTVLLNTRGTKFMLDLAEECEKLQIFLHLSTAYCQLNERILYEKAYPTPANPHYIISMMEWMDEEIIDKITKDILGDYPNGYAYSKALSEAVVIEKMDKLPVVILRPSVVIPIWKDPIPGWTDNINGPAGILIGAGKGVIRSMYINENLYADFIPVDIVANVLAISPFAYFQNNEKRIYNITSSTEYKVSWRQIIEIGTEVLKNIPLNWAVWYPGGSMKSTRFAHNVAAVFFHYIPAVFIDGLLILLGYKPILWRIHQRIRKGFEVFDYYANRQWDFNNDNGMAVRQILNETENNEYPIEIEDLDLLQYFSNCSHGARLYILNEPDYTIPTARRHMKVMWCLDKICKALFGLGCFYVVFKYILAPATENMLW